MIGRRTRFRENDDLPLWRGLPVKKSRHFIMRANRTWNYAQYGCAIPYRGMTLKEQQSTFYYVTCLYVMAFFYTETPFSLLQRPVLTYLTGVPKHCFLKFPKF